MVLFVVLMIGSPIAGGFAVQPAEATPSGAETASAGGPSVLAQNATHRSGAVATSTLTETTMSWQTPPPRRVETTDSFTVTVTGQNRRSGELCLYADDPITDSIIDTTTVACKNVDAGDYTVSFDVSVADDLNVAPGGHRKLYMQLERETYGGTVVAAETAKRQVAAPQEPAYPDTYPWTDVQELPEKAASDTGLKASIDRERIDPNTYEITLKLDKNQLQDLRGHGSSQVLVTYDADEMTVFSVESGVDGGKTTEMETAEAITSVLDLVSLGSSTSLKAVAVEVVKGLAEEAGYNFVTSFLHFDTPAEHTTAEGQEALLVDFSNDQWAYDEVTSIGTYTLKLRVHTERDIESSDLRFLLDMRGEAIKVTTDRITGTLPLFTEYRREVVVNVPSPNADPTAEFALGTSAPETDESVRFDASSSADSDGSITEYKWDFDGDGTIDKTASEPVIAYDYDQSGTKTVRLTTVDDDGATATTQRSVTISSSTTSVVADPETWDIGSTLESGTRTKTIHITNEGDDPTDVSISGGSGLSISDAPSALNAGETASFQVTLDADQYDGTPVVVTHEGGKTAIPLSVTVIGDDELTRTEDASVEDEHNCGGFITDVYGDQWTFCDVSGRVWSDTANIPSDEYAGIDSAELRVSVRADGDERQDNPLEVYLNGQKLTEISSPPADDDYHVETIPVPVEDLDAGDNTVKLKTSGYSSYDVEDDFDDTALHYTYFEEVDLDLSVGEFDKEVRVGETVRVPVSVKNDGGRTATDVVLGTSGGTDGDAIDVVKWPDGYAPGSEETLDPKQSDVRYFEIELTEDRSANVEFGTASNTDDADTTITLTPPNDPPVVGQASIWPDTATAGESIQYAVDVLDHDGDTVNVELQVWDPSAGSWESVGSQQVDGIATARWYASPFEVDDEGESTTYRVVYDDGNGHAGTWGPFAGPTVIDDDTSGPETAEWRYPGVIRPGDSVPVSVDVSDPSGVASVTLHYHYSNGTNGTATMSKANGSWHGTVPSVGDDVSSVSFSVEATDGDASPATSHSLNRQAVVRENSDGDGWYDSYDPTPNTNNTDATGPDDGVGGEGFQDTDGDGIQNYADPDNDGDGLDDGEDPAILVVDADGDGFSDYYEVQSGTDPLDPDDRPNPDAPLDVSASASRSVSTVGTSVAFEASVANASLNATLEWDLDDDGEFDDASGRTATATFTTTGSHAVAVRATDGEDTAVGTAGVEVRSSPTVSATAVESVVSSRPVEISWDATLTGNATTLAYRIDGGSLTNVSTDDVRETGTLTLSEVSNGSHTVEFTLLDSSGDPLSGSATEAQATFDLDVSGPSVDSVTLDEVTRSDGAVRTNGSIGVEARLSDRNGVSSARVVLSPDNYSFEVTVPATKRSESWDAEIPARFVPVEGNYSLVVVAEDDTGNENEKTVETVVVDETAPELAVTVAQNADETAALTIESSEPLDRTPDVTISHTGTTTPVSVSQDSPTKWSGTFDLSGSGAYRIEATGRDETGNLGTARAVTVVQSSIRTEDRTTTLVDEQSGTFIRLRTERAVEDGTALFTETDSPLADLPASQIGASFIDGRLGSDLSANLTEATIGIPVNESRLPDGLPTESVNISYYNGTTGEWEELPTTITTEEGRRYWTANVTHFSVYGAIARDDAAPSVTAASPAVEEVAANQSVQVRYEFTDGGSGVNLSTLSLNVDGRDVTTEAEVTDGAIEYTIDSPSLGNHTARLSVEDEAGNRVREPVTFEVTENVSDGPGDGDDGDSGGDSDEESGGSSGGGGTNVEPPDPTVELEPRGDGFYADVQNGREGLSIPIELSADPTAGVAYESVTVTMAAKNPHFAFTLTPRTNSSDGLGEPSGPDAVGGHLTMTPKYITGEHVSEVRYRFSVIDALISDAGGSPESVVLYQYRDGKWRALPTTHRGGNRYAATAPGYSTVAVGVKSVSDSDRANDGTTKTSASGGDESDEEGDDSNAGTSRPSESAGSSDDSGGDSGGASIPGFGVGVALVALLAALLVSAAVRRD
ncbi:PKD domain-containing protein [Halorussus lipolyticus]|uniref:PKD domain-containing protein n=1 Tax=Halorussus lipolyticus TaxID=3034024 RepID=UPI0023E897ED|nr:PKD domain-containing protein [Halorussus sp. DT80]